MKVGITIPTLNVAGGVKCLLKMGALLSERGHDVQYYWQAYSLKNYFKTKWFPPQITWTDSPYKMTPVRSWNQMPKDCDVMIASSWRTATAVSAWAQRYGKKGIYYVQHHEAIWDGGEDAASTYRLPLEFVVISSWLKDIMKNDYAQESTLLVTPVDPLLFQSESTHEDRHHRVLMLHHTFDWKGFDEGVEAFKRVKQYNPQIQLVVLGGREENPQLPENAEYHFKPDKDELRKLYASCGVFLCPSWHEGLGMPSMEAMATGALLVTTDTGGSQDFAIHGETAFVSPARDVESLASNLQMALKQWYGLEGLRDAGRERIRHFNWAENADKLEELINGAAQ